MVRTWIFAWSAHLLHFFCQVRCFHRVFRLFLFGGRVAEQPTSISSLIPSPLTTRLGDHPIWFIWLYSTSIYWAVCLYSDMQKQDMNLREAGLVTYWDGSLILIHTIFGLEDASCLAALLQVGIETAEGEGLSPIDVFFSQCHRHRFARLYGTCCLCGMFYHCPTLSIGWSCTHCRRRGRIRWRVLSRGLTNAG